MIILSGGSMEKHYYSFKEIVESLPKKKNGRSSLWVKTIIRKLSFVFTYLFVNIGISPWLASVLSAVVAFTGSVLMCINSFPCRIIGVICIQLWLVLDCVDGNIARVTKTCSDLGDFIDTLSGYVVSACAMLSIGVAAAYTTKCPIFLNNNLLVVFGAMGSIGNVFARLIHQNYMVTIFRLEKKGIIITNPDDDVEADHGIGYLRSRIDKEFGISGFFMPLLIIALITNRLDIFTMIYSAFFTLSALAICVYYALKSKI